MSNASHSTEVYRRLIFKYTQTSRPFTKYFDLLLSQYAPWYISDSRVLALYPEQFKFRVATEYIPTESLYNASQESKAVIYNAHFKLLHTEYIAFTRITDT